MTIGNETANNSISANKNRNVIVLGEFFGEGPHNISGGNVNLYGPLVARAAEAPINIRAASYIYGYERNTGHGLAAFPYSGLQTNQGDITLWANEGTYNDGLVNIADRYILNNLLGDNLAPQYERGLDGAEARGRIEVMEGANLTATSQGRGRRLSTSMLNTTMNKGEV